MPKSERAGSELDDKKPSPWNRFESFGYARTDFSLLSIFEFEHDNRHRVDVSANEKRLFTIQLRDIEESVMRSYQVLYFIFTGSLPVFRLEFTPAS
ncbi:MAG TPA: hypothetical protein VL498_01635 [Terracidiphilus sp.]|jgi:hypothetical protein|nr:hypothetical protein [Terracidiphilus sp.]